jgi:hypothetical protein
MRNVDKLTDTASFTISEWLPAVGKLRLQTGKLCVEHTLWLEIIGVIAEDQRVKM